MKQSLTAMFLSVLIIVLIFAAPKGITKAASSGDLIKCPDFSSVYYLAEDGKRYVFPNEKIYFTWYEDFDDVVNISCDELGDYSIGGNITYQAGTRLVKIPSVPTVYAVEPDGLLRSIASEEQAKNLYGSDWATRVDDLPESFFGAYEVGDPLEDDEAPEGTILKDDGGNYFRVEGDGTILEMNDVLAEGVGLLLKNFPLSLEELRENFDLDLFVTWFEDGDIDLDEFLEEFKTVRIETEEDDFEYPTDAGPWQNDLMYTWGNGTTFEESETFIEHAGVPSVIEDASGRLIAAFQWFPDDADGFDQVAVAISEDDGKTWSDPETIEIEDFPSSYQRPFDPALALTEDARIRLYFTSSTEIPAEDIAIFSAISDDGIHYTFESGSRLDVEDDWNYDPAALFFDNAWRLITPSDNYLGSSYYATSSDGLDFTEPEVINVGQGLTWIGNLVEVSGKMRFYGNSMEGIWWSSTENGEDWSDPEYTNVQGGDPALVKVGSRYLLIYVGISGNE